ncbi:hypothetical protein M9Y10_039386 [Tritrichomonas musculus]|uniref:Protein kinase domain-containing protein n=1 Tax=Tritrichomonas musculus TaxID=1915356 RepID=A0ABR2KE78_9EUKA
MAEIVLDQKRSTESNFHINLNKYENLEKNLSNTVSNYKVCTIEENETKIQYTARIYYNELHQFSKSEIKNFCQELRIIPQLNHPAIIKFIGYSPINFENKPTPTVVTDKYSRVHYCNWKFDVNKLLLDSFSFNDTEKLILLFGVASAMSYLHSHNIIHRDLKLENIDTNQLPRLFGFHFAKEIKGDFCKCHHLKGTPAFLAPEVLKNLEYSKSSDVYSFAYLMYIIMTNQRPFSDDQSPQQLIKKICDEKIRPEFKLPIPKCYRQLIERCWSEDPSKRPSFDDILSELRTNRDFITDTVIEKQYLEYVSYIDNYPITFDSSKRIPQIDEIMNNKLNTFIDFNFDMGNREIYESEFYNVSFDNKFELSDYEKQKKIGKGNFYKVWLIRNKITNERFAAKKILALYDRNSALNFTQEVNLYLQFNHPSILKYIGYSPIGFQRNLHEIVVTEYAPMGSLKNILEQNKDLNDTKKLINIYGIASAMLYLHSNNVLHRDLKTEHIFLTKDCYPKLSGFHLSVETQFKSTYEDNKRKGTPLYLSPEVWTEMKYSKSSDVYSFAFAVYEIITNKKPFQEFVGAKELAHEICDNCKRPEIDASVPECYKQLIEKCWSQDPKERPTFEMIVSDLKTNKNYMTENVDEIEFYNYIKFIDESPKSFDTSKKIRNLPEFIQARPYLFYENDTEFGFKKIDETECDSISIDLDTVHIEDYEKQKMIYNTDSFKIYEVIEKKSKKIFLAKTFENLDDISLEINTQLILKNSKSSFLKFIGCSPFNFKKEPKPVIIYENASNGSLQNLLEISNKNDKIQGWTDTKKLIFLYGLASGMSYLNSLNYIHYNLKPENIFLDDFLFPKIGGLEMSRKINGEHVTNMFHIITLMSPYEPPDLFYDEHNFASRDVYSFGLITYHFITNEKPFDGISSPQIFSLLEDCKRPEFKRPILDCYRKLIEKCWSQDPNDRPTFEEIVSHLRNNKEFITDTIDLNEYENYINFIENNHFKNEKSTEQLDNFIESQNRTFRKVKIDQLKKDPVIHFSIDMGSLNLDHYSKKAKIGSGAFGNVYTAIKKDTNEVNAAKVSIYELDQCSDDIIMNLTREVEIMANLNHPAILQFLGYSPNNFKNKPKPVILTEFAAGGSLDKIIELERNNCGNHEWNETKKLINLYGIAAGMAYLHRNDYIHRDLKPANILLDENLYPKIADFGLSKKLNNNQQDNDDSIVVPSGFKGTYPYCSPEIIFNQEYGFKGDVYAYGMIAYEIMTNELPFEKCNIYQIIAKLHQGYLPDFKYPIPYCYRHLITKCLSRATYNRPKFDEIVEALETRKEFITSDVDEDEYMDYISMIKQDDEIIMKHPQEKQKQQEKESKQIEVNNNEADLKRVEEIDNDDLNLQRVEEIDNDDLNLQRVEEIDNDDLNLQRVEEVENDESEEIFLDINKFKRENIISKSNLFKVYKFTSKENEMKFIGQMSMINIRPFSKEDISNLKSNFDILYNISHPSLLKFIGFSPVDFKKQQKPVIVTEYASNGTLSHVLEIERDNKDIEGWNFTKKMINLYGIASGMSYLHSLGICHSSLDPDNVFLGDSLTPKLGYFGISKQFQVEEQMSHQSMSGFNNSTAYLAPEVIENNEYSQASDVYAFAFIMFEVLSNEKPFNGINSNQIINEVVVNETRPKMNDRIPESCRELIDKCWSQDPKKRPSFKDILDFIKSDKELIDDDLIKYANFVDSS